MAELKLIHGGLSKTPGYVKIIPIKKHIPPLTLLDELIEDLKAVYYSDYKDLKTQVYSAIRTGGLEEERRRLNHVWK